MRIFSKRVPTVILAAIVLGTLMFPGNTAIVNANHHNDDDVIPTFEYRSIDGSGNNLMNHGYGKAGIPLMRMSAVDYEDGKSKPAGESRLSPRAISNIVVDQGEQSITNSAKASDMVWQWGQFLDHDMDLTPSNPAEPFPIPVPECDHSFDPSCTGNQVISFSRSIHDGGHALENPRQQMNIITAFIDASNVYGSDGTTADALRMHSGGKLLTSTGDFLPFNGAGPFYLAGDARVNEQIFLTAMHTLFVREHNRLADEVAAKHPELDPESDDEQIYQYVRKIVGAQIQVITYKEWLPLLLGERAIPEYDGYDPTVNSGIANEFSTASFRFGHSMLSPDILRITNSGEVLVVHLRDAFFNPAAVPMHDGIDSMLRGLPAQRAQEIDRMIVDDVRNFLFGPPGSGGLDLASLNMQRGRDHGLPDYNTVRAAYGLPRVTSFAEISSNPEVQEALESAYGSVDDIDLWVGGLAEDHVPGALVGETIRAVLVDQFTRLRDGDRFWYANDPFFHYYKDWMQEVKKTTLSDIIKRNTTIGDELQHNVFICAAPKKLLSGDWKQFCN